MDCRLMDQSVDGLSVDGLSVDGLSDLQKLMDCLLMDCLLTGSLLTDCGGTLKTGSLVRFENKKSTLKNTLVFDNAGVVVVNSGASKSLQLQRQRCTRLEGF
jgi:hypothetical protein